MVPTKCQKHKDVWLGLPRFVFDNSGPEGRSLFGGQAGYLYLETIRSSGLSGHQTPSPM